MFDYIRSGSFSQTRYGCRSVLQNMWSITAVIGAMLFLRPYQGTKAVVMLIGLNLGIDGILNLFVVQSTVTTIRK